MASVKNREKPKRLCPCPKHLANSKEIKPCDIDRWQRIDKSYEVKNVFINVPYVNQYKIYRHIIWSTLFYLGLNPVLASERETGDLRLCKICELMQICKYGISDLSYPDRHNIPFELGFMMALGKRITTLLMDEKYDKSKRKFDERISNLKFFDIIYHKWDKKTLIKNLINRLNNDFQEIQIFPPTKDLYIRNILTISDQVAKLADKGLDYSTIAGKLLQKLARKKI